MTKRFIITLVIVLLVLAGSYLTLPGLEVLLDADNRLFFPEWVPNIFSLGAWPYLDILAYAWALALFIPRLRKALFAGSKTVQRWVLGLSVVIMLAQAYLQVSTLQQDYGFSGYYVEPLLDPSLTETIMLMALLTGGSLALVALAGVITRKGLGNGLAAVTAISCLPAMTYAVYRAFICAPVTPDTLLDPWTFGTFTILTVGSFLLFFWRRRLPLVTGDRQQDAGVLRIRVVNGGLFRYFLAASLSGTALTFLFSVCLISMKIFPGSHDVILKVMDSLMSVVGPLFCFATLYLMGRVMSRPTALAAGLKEKGLLLKGVPEDETGAALRRHADINALISSLVITLICQAPFLGLQPADVNFIVPSWLALMIVPAWIADLALSYKHPGQEDTERISARP